MLKFKTYLAEKFESIVHKQSQIEERLVNILVNLSSGEMSMVEKNAAKELRETARQVSKLEKSVDRVKVLSSKVQPIKVSFTRLLLRIDESC